MRSCKCFPHVSKMPTLIYNHTNIVVCFIHLIFVTQKLSCVYYCSIKDSLVLVTHRILLLVYIKDSLALVTPHIFFCWRGKITDESILLIAASIGDKKLHLDNGKDAYHQLKACLYLEHFIIIFYLFFQ